MLFKTIRQHLTKNKPRNKKQASINCIYSIKYACGRDTLEKQKGNLKCYKGFICNTFVL